MDEDEFEKIVGKKTAVEVETSIKEPRKKSTTK